MQMQYNALTKIPIDSVTRQTLVGIGSIQERKMY